MIVSTHSRPKAAGRPVQHRATLRMVSTHSRLKAAGQTISRCNAHLDVSTHSRLKAAGIDGADCIDAYFSFNTQPPEGGWVFVITRFFSRFSFNTQPPEGGWRPTAPCCCASRGFNTQPPEGGWAWNMDYDINRTVVSTHSRLKAAGLPTCRCSLSASLFQHTAA